MGNVSYDRHGLIVDGRRTWLISGTLHPFRIPREEWGDRLQAAVDAGLNCIEFYTAWNRVEPEPGRFDFGDENDYAHLLDLCRRLGLFAIVRPGPYICAEWDQGGYPAWLAARGLPLRENHPEADPLVDRYLAEVCRRVAPFQRTATGDGPVILVQVENEYWMGERPGGDAWLAWLQERLRHHGITVPLIDCDMLFRRPKSLHAINGYWCFPRMLRGLRREFPEQPLLATEYHCGWFTSAGRPRPDLLREPRHFARNNLGFLARGVMKNFYLFAGGTSFGGWGGSNGPEDPITASYDFDAPLAEGGGRTDKFFHLRLTNRIERLFAPFLLEAERPAETGQVFSHPHAITRATPAGDLLFVLNSMEGMEATETVIAHDLWGDRFTVRFDADCAARVLPVAFTLAPGLRIDWIEAQILHHRRRADGDDLYLCDLPGVTSTASLNGQRLDLAFPRAGEAPRRQDAGRIRLHLLTWRQALRFVPEDAAPAGFRLEEPPVLATASPRRIDGWRGAALVDTLDALAWTTLPALASREALGCSDQSALHRATVSVPADGARLHLIGDHEPVQVLIDGRCLGRLGGKGLRRPLSLPPGRHDLLLHVGAWGRSHAVRRDPARSGPVAALWAEDVPLALDEAGTCRLRAADCRELLANEMVLNARLDIPAEADLHLLRLRAGPADDLLIEVPDQAGPWFVRRDDRIMHFSSGRGWSWRGAGAPGDLTLGFLSAAHRDRCREQGVQALAVRPCPLADLRSAVFAAPTPVPEGRPSAGAPAWWATSLHLDRVPERGLLLDLTCLSRGQVHLNGRYLARYWHPGPQTRYWMPASWLRPGANDLALFDEEGCPPQAVTVAEQAWGPFDRAPRGLVDGGG